MLSKKDFLGEFESLKDALMVNAFVGIGNGRKTDVFDAIKNHNKPVVVFGA